MTKRRSPFLRNAGFTLIEVIFFIVVVGVALSGVLTVFQTTVRSSNDPVMRKQALAAAESLLDEILLTGYANPPGGDTGTVRAAFDDVAQYNGFNTTAGITDKQGTAIAGLERYNFNPAVQVLATTAAQQAQLSALTVPAGAAPAWRITVFVTAPDGSVVSVVGYRSCYRDVLNAAGALCP